VRHPRPELRLSDWSLLGPFDNPAGTAVDVDLGPDKYVKRMKAGEPWSGLDEAFLARDKKRIFWRRVRVPLSDRPAEASPFDSGTLDIAALLGISGPAVDRAAAYLYREIQCSEARSVSIACGSDDGLRLWLNGELLVDHAEMRALNPYDERVTLSLRPGRNHLLAKVTNLGGPWSFALLEPLAATQDEIDHAIDRGVEWLLDRQLFDGSWAEQQEAYRSGVASLVVYTLLHCGVSPRHSAILQALEHLAAFPADRTYSLSCQVLALAASGDPACRPQLALLVQQLLSWQESSGGWSYPQIHADLSNTQIAAFSLRAAANAGIEVPPDRWSKMVDFAMRHREPRHRTETSGFSYLPADTVTGSMTAAGISLLALCREALGERMPPRVRGEVEAAIQDGLSWLDANWSVSHNPKKGDFHLYYLYGLERIGALLGLDRIGEHDWYAEGAQWLVRSQGSDGDWQGSAVDTCFGLLFLERATGRPLSLERGDGGARVVSTEEGAGAIRLHVRCGTPAEFWIDPPAFPGNAVLQRLDFLVRPQHEKWTVVEAGVDGRLAARFSFPFPAKWEIRAEAELSDGTRLESASLVVLHDEGLSAELASRARGALANRLQHSFPATTSSSAKDDAPASNATDNRSWTRWLCAQSDSDPWIDVELVRETTVARLIFTHARTTKAENATANPRPARIELWIDRQETPRTIALDPGPAAQTIVVFSPPLALSKFRARIVELVDGELGHAEVGFTEIELQRPDPAVAKDPGGR